MFAHCCHYLFIMFQDFYQNIYERNVSYHWGLIFYSVMYAESQTISHLLNATKSLFSNFQTKKYVTQRGSMKYTYLNVFQANMLPTKIRISKYGVEINMCKSL